MIGSHTDSDDTGNYVELCFTNEMVMVILDEQHLSTFDERKEVATLRIYVPAEAKKAVVIKEDDLLTKKEILHHAKDVAVATAEEIKIWIENKCFKKRLLKGSRNIMTSRYAAKWKWIKKLEESWARIIRMRMVLRGFMDPDKMEKD